MEDEQAVGEVSLMERWEGDDDGERERLERVGKYSLRRLEGGWI